VGMEIRILYLKRHAVVCSLPTVDCNACVAPCWFLRPTLALGNLGIGTTTLLLGSGTLQTRTRVMGVFLICRKRRTLIASKKKHGGSDRVALWRRRAVKLCDRGASLFMLFPGCKIEESHN
jgi:hypothetical protein